MTVTCKTYAPGGSPLNETSAAYGTRCASKAPSVGILCSGVVITGSLSRKTCTCTARSGKPTVVADVPAETVLPAGRAPSFPGSEMSGTVLPCLPLPELVEPDAAL